MKDSLSVLEKRNAKRKHWKETLPDPAPFIVRNCLKCKQDKPCRWNKCFSPKGVPEYKSRCVDCQKGYDKNSRTKNRQGITGRAQAKKLLVKKKCIAYLGGSCVSCGYNKSPRALTFHHRDRASKFKSISQMKDWSWAKIEQELVKCDLMCFNCHMEAEDEYESEKNNVGERGEGEKRTDQDMVAT